MKIIMNIQIYRILVFKHHIMYCHSNQIITREAWLAVGAALMRQNTIINKNDPMDDFCLSLLFGNY